MSFPKEIRLLIASYVIDIPMKLLDWIFFRKEDFDWDFLSGNPGAIYLLEKNQDKIDWFCLYENPFIFEIDQIEYKKKLREF